MSTASTDSTNLSPEISPNLSNLAAQYATLGELLADLGDLETQCLAAPYPSDHARTLLLAGPHARSAPTCVIKIARLASAEAFMQNAMRLREQLPERFGRLRLVFPQWQGHIAGQLTTVEPFAAGRRIGRGATGELLREWLELTEELGPAIQGLEEQIVDRETVDAFLARHKLPASLARLAQHHESWFYAAPAFSHGDLSPHNILRHAGDLCIVDWDFARRISLRRFDGFYALLTACMPLKNYKTLRVRFALMHRRHGDPLRWKSPPEEALMLTLLFLAIHSEAKNLRAGFPPESPYLEMLRQRWRV